MHPSVFLSQQRKNKKNKTQSPVSPMGTLWWCPIKSENAVVSRICYQHHFVFLHSSFYFPLIILIFCNVLVFFPCFFSLFQCTFLYCFPSSRRNDLSPPLLLILYIYPSLYAASCSSSLYLSLLCVLFDFALGPMLFQSVQRTEYVCFGK